MMSASTFLSPPSKLLFEIEPIKGSRFFASLGPVASASEAKEFVQQITKEYADATHNCWAWRVGSKGEQFRSSDDGEPGGSAGRPILAQIEGHAATNTAVVVTRYYGGTKLGVGGLMRAYGGCAGKALDQANLAPVIIRRRLIVSHPYECSGAVEGVLTAAGIQATESSYAGHVRLILDVPEEQLQALKFELRERTAARAELEETDSDVGPDEEPDEGPAEGPDA